MKTLKIKDYDIIYLSYDEPNAEKNYADLCSKVPWAKRVHGVKGSDSAHKACAELSETERFITIDGDNIINSDFLNQEIILYDHADLSKAVISWCGKNIINGLTYGNGGIKCWPKQHVLDMKTHENAEVNNIRAQVDFCWDMQYIQQDGCFSTVHNNETPQQAWRAGFREGVKMALSEGAKVSKEELLTSHWKNLTRLYIWLMVGIDVKNGRWAIHGAREGLYKTMCTDWDYINVRDFEWLNNYWDNKDIADIDKQTENLGSLLINELNVPISAKPLDAQQSVFFKTVYRNPPRLKSSLVIDSSKDILKNSKYDIVMITYGESNADENFKRLKEKYPEAKRLNNIKGIHQAHQIAANMCDTEMFWVVDGDAIIDDNFDFSYEVSKWDLDVVHVCDSINPINDLVYGYGAVKLLPRKLTADMDTTKPDMTTSISTKFKKIHQVSNITAFNTDSFNTWRSAFRECCKLSSKVIDRQKDKETEDRLDVWCSVGKDRPFGNYAIAGALSGREYGESNKGNIEALKKINDFEWLKEKYNESTS